MIKKDKGMNRHYTSIIVSDLISNNTHTYLIMNISRIWSQTVLFTSYTIETMIKMIKVCDTGLFTEASFVNDTDP